MGAAPALALSWQLWSRQRWTAVALLLAIGALGVAAHQPGALQWRANVFAAAIPLSFALFFFIARFAYPEGDVLGRASSFPPDQLLLPVRTAELVFWPMLHGGLSIAAAWIAFAMLVLRPLDVGVPLVWPAVLAATCMAWLQALLWTPMGLPYLRVLLAIVSIPALITGTIEAIVHGIAPAIVTACLFAALLLAYGMAVAGLHRTRRGDVPDWTWRPRERSGAAAPDQATRTAAQAQCEYEWRSAGWLLPVVNTAVFVLLSLPLLWVRELTPLRPNAPAGSFEAIELNLWLKLQLGCLFFPPLLGTILGFGRRSYDTAPRDFSLHPFMAVRPLREAAFVQARCRAALRGTALTWGMTLLFVAAWLLLPARDGEREGPLLILLPRYCPPATAATVLVVLVVLVAWTWKSQVQGMWADLSGSPVLVYGAPLLAHGLVLMTLSLLASNSGAPSDMDPRYRPVPPLIVGLVVSGLLAKVALTVVTCAALVRQRLQSPAELMRRAAGWLAGAAALLAGLTWLAAAGSGSGPLASLLVMTYLPLCHDAVPAAFHSPPFLVAVSLLFWPFNRLSLAALMLHRNRHR